MEEMMEMQEAPEMENGAEMPQMEQAEEAAQMQEAPTPLEHAASAVDAVWSRLSEELTGLHRDGWTIGELQAFAQDEGVRTAIASGETARQAATAYLMRMAEKEGKEVMPQTTQGEAQKRRERKRSVPALRTATTGSVPQGNAIARLSSSEFARFSDSVYERLMAGEKIAL